MNAYEAKQARRRERFEGRAAHASAESNLTSARASAMLDVIPPGQPILVGHHSEGRHRAHLAKMDRTFRAASELHEKAEYYARKAAGVGTAGISGDDPDAIDKLKEQLEQVEKASLMMKAANRAIRAGKLDDLPKIGFSADAITQITTSDYMGRKGFPAFSLSNNRANAARIRARIEALEKAGQRSDREEAGNGYTYREDKTENRVMFVFDGKPDEATRTILKRHAFKWSPTRAAWVRQTTPNALAAARYVRLELDQ